MNPERISRLTESISLLPIHFVSTSAWLLSILLIYCTSDLQHHPGRFTVEARTANIPRTSCSWLSALATTHKREPQYFFNHNFQPRFCEQNPTTTPSEPPTNFSMGKNGRFGKDYGKVAGSGDNRPGWKGPAFVKKSEQKTKPKSQIITGSKDDPEESEPNVPIDLQQRLLNVFRDAFPEVLTSGTLKPLLQEVKSALFERDFTRAFGKSEYLEAYSARWSPSRALCYQSILLDVEEHLREITHAPSSADPGAGLEETGNVVKSKSHILSSVCFGGGAAEVIAFGGYDRSLRDASEEAGERGDSHGAVKFDVLLIDSAGWENVVKKLHTGLITPPPLSKYASASAQAANNSLLPAEAQESKFLQSDLLDMTADELRSMVGGTPKLLTLLFTLNELYTSSISKTTAFLLNLTMTTKPGTLLLVVDSPGSYSTTSVGADAKKYPMKFLLDHTLLETQKVKAEGDDRRRESPPDWVKVVSNDAKWFRIPEELRYSIPLENMRYQIHLYRRSGIRNVIT